MSFCSTATHGPIYDWTNASRLHTKRQLAYDLKKLRGKDLITKLGRSRRYAVSPPGMRAITAALVLREHVIRPVLAGVRTPAILKTPTIPIQTDQHYERLRLAFHPLFQELGIATQTTPLTIMLP